MASLDNIPNALLQAIGTDVLRSFVSITVETWAVVIYTVLVFKAAMILLTRKRRRSKLPRVTLAIVLVMYFVNCTLWIIDVHNIVGELNTTLVSGSADSLSQRYDLFGAKALRLEIVEDVLYSYMTILGDTIVLWRVYTFCANGKDRFLLILPLMAYSASIVLSGLVTYCAAQSDADISLGAFSHPAFCQNVQWSSYWAQLATAAVSTALVGYKTWQYRQLVRSYLGDSGIHKSPVNGALMIILDTGVIYTLFFCTEVIMMFPAVKRSAFASPSLSFALEIYQFLTSSIVGIYPTIVVILVHTHCTLLDSSGNPSIASIRRAERTNAGSAGWSDSFPSVPEVRYRGRVAEIGLHELKSAHSRFPEDQLEMRKDAKVVDSVDSSGDIVLV